MNRRKSKKNKSSNNELQNGLTSLTQSLIPYNPMMPNIAIGDTAPINQTGGLYYSNRYYPITLHRNLLDELYLEHGIVQTMIDQPVEDAYRGKLKIASSQLDDEEIEELEKEARKRNLFEIIKTTQKWNRLFGGAGIIINVDGQEPSEPLDTKKIKKGTDIEFYSADRWELTTNPFYETHKLRYSVDSDIKFNFYGVSVDASRVYVLKGKEAPSLKRLQLQGWGMSELERLVSSLNRFMKNQNVIFELLDEAKIDVYSLDGYRTSLIAGQEQEIQKSIMMTNQMKNYLNALVLDKEDEFSQKQIAFAGMAELLREARLDIASSLKMPVTKIFGMSSAGFNSGEDDIENYNSMIETDIRTPSRNIIINLLEILCLSTFGFAPDDLSIEFPSLRVLKDTELEAKKTTIYQRGRDLYAMKLITKGEFYDYLSRHEIIDQDLKIKDSEEYAEIGAISDDFSEISETKLNIS